MWRLREKFSVFPIKARQYRYRNSTSAPYLSGDAFAALCDISVTTLPLTTGEILALPMARSIFIRAHLLEDFLSTHSNDVNAISLVTGNSDRNFDVSVELPNSVRLWLCQNNAIANDPIVHTLPIGIENIALGKNGLTHSYAEKEDSKILNRVLVPPMSSTNPIRPKVVREAQRRVDLFDVYTNYLSTSKYFDLAGKYQFVLCLEGNGFENHRIWETLYRDSFPVLLSTRWSETLRELNLPILIVKEISELDSKTLLEFVETHKNYRASNCGKLWTPVWKSIIQSGSYD